MGLTVVGSEEVVLNVVGFLVVELEYITFNLFFVIYR
jgi:hypothetical protein